jgi:CheY-like chemotaxis protein
MPLLQCPTVTGERIRPLRILIVEDDFFVREAIAIELEDHRTVMVANGKEALEVLRHEEFDLVLCDLHMPIMSGLELHEALVRELPHVVDRIVFMTACPFTPDAVRLQKLSKRRILSKPFDAGALVALAREAAA